MSTPVIEVLLATVLAAIGAVVWFVRLEGRVNLLDRVMTDHLTDSKQVLGNLQMQMGRVEMKIDRLSLRCIAWQHHHLSIPRGDDEDTQTGNGS